MGDNRISMAEFEGRPVGSILSKEIVAVIVRTTISAMREPTEEMVIAGSDETCTNANRTEAHASWVNMIDAALK